MRRVVITGAGCITPLGNGLTEVSESLFVGRNGLSHCPATNSMAGMLSFNDTEGYSFLEQQSTNKMARISYAAYKQAAGDIVPDGLYFGSGGLALPEVTEGIYELENKNRVRPTSLVSTLHNSAASFIASRSGIDGPVYTYSVACSSSTVAIGEAYKAIAYGDINSAAAGGGEFCLIKQTAAQWRAMHALSDKCKPFSKSRNGIALGEGAAFFLLQEYQQAKESGANILAEIVGYGISHGSETITKPNQNGQIKAMERALKGIDRSRITYINAHGTGTPVGDMVELGSIKHVLGQYVADVPVSSTKNLHGHLLGNAGGMEMLTCLTTLTSEIIIPNWGLEDVDPEVPEGVQLPIVPFTKKQDVVLNNSFAFGGTNTVLALRRC